MKTDDADLAAGGPFAHAARFVSVDPAQRRCRFYELRLQGALWGGVALVRGCGRGAGWGRRAAPA